MAKILKLTARPSYIRLLSFSSTIIACVLLILQVSFVIRPAQAEGGPTDQVTDEDRLQWQEKLKHAKSLREKLLLDQDRDFVFTGRVVFESGEPAPNTVVTLALESMVKSKEFDRVLPQLVEFARTTDVNGFFTLEGQGHLLRIHKIDGPGLWLYDEAGGARDIRHPNNRGYYVGKVEGVYQHIINTKRPAIFVLIRSKEVINAWPSRGGADQFQSGLQFINSPIIPLKPSVPLIYTEKGWMMHEDTPPPVEVESREWKNSKSREQRLRSKQDEQSRPDPKPGSE